MVSNAGFSSDFAHRPNPVCSWRFERFCQVQSPTSTVVEAGATATLTVSPASGAIVVRVAGCGGALTGPNTYVTGPVSADSCDQRARSSRAIDQRCGSGSAT